jgi:hypothetical protein
MVGGASSTTFARWATKIDRTPTFEPVNLSFDRDSSLTQLLPPRLKVFRLRSEHQSVANRFNGLRGAPSR